MLEVLKAAERAVRQLFESSPFTIIQDGNYNELKRRLDEDGLSPNFNEHKRSLLIAALENKQIGMAILLLQHKAEPNLDPVEPKSEESLAFFIAFGTLRSPSLTKLLLTYGARWNDLEPYHIGQPSPHVSFLRKVKAECLSLYDTLKEAQDCFQEKRYEEAYKKFSDAKKQLDAFGQEEQKMLETKDTFYKSYEACRDDYFHRSRLCQEKMSLCLKALKIDPAKEIQIDERHLAVSESVPLLSSSARGDDKWDEKEIRGRIYSKSAPASTSSLSSISASAQLATNLNSLLCSSSPVTAKTSRVHQESQKESNGEGDHAASTAQMHFKNA